MEYVYFVSYSHSSGFGSAEVVMQNEIRSFKDILTIKKALEGDKKLKEVIVLYYTRLR